MKLHTGKILTETELRDALKIVADDLRKSAISIRNGKYASHVTEEQKDKIKEKNLTYADEVEKGLHNRNFTIWQRIDYLLTGESVAFLP